MLSTSHVVSVKGTKARVRIDWEKRDLHLEIGEISSEKPAK